MLSFAGSAGLDFKYLLSTVSCELMRTTIQTFIYIDYNLGLRLKLDFQLRLSKLKFDE